MPKLQSRLFFPAEKMLDWRIWFLFHLEKKVFLPALLQLTKKTGGTGR